MKLTIVLCVLFHITSLYSVFMDEIDQSEKNTPLHEAVLDDNYVNVKKLIGKGADKNAKNNIGRTPLHVGCQKGFENIVKLLINSRADIAIKDYYGRTPLQYAAQYGHFDIFKLLLQEYENWSIDFTNTTDVMGMSLLHYAAMNRKPRNTDILRMLLEKQANVKLTASDKTTPLHYAAATGNPDMVQLLLDWKAGESVNFKDTSGNTPIIYATYGTGEGRQKVIELLIKNSADVNTVNDLGETTLFFVARGGDDENLARYLIKQGARVNVNNIQGETPLHYAAKMGHKKLGKCFIENNANKDAINNDKQSSLHYAVKYGQIEFAEMLIDLGANVMLADENRNTALHLAVEEAQGHVKMLALLSNGIDVNNFKKNGKSLLHLCIEKGGDMKTFKWLIDKGASIGTTDRDGWSLIHSAARYGRKDIVEWLFKHHSVDGIINKQDSYGNSPLHFAVKGGRDELTKVLLSNGSDVNAMNYDFERPIHFAANGGHEEIVKLLMDYDATVNVKNRIDWTPLFYSVLNGNENVVKILTNHKDEDFSLNDKDAQGKTVFHICAEKGTVNVAKILFSHGGNLSAVDELGRTPLHSAAASGNSEFVGWIIESQPTVVDNEDGRRGVNAIDNNRQTPLHLAAEKGYEKVVRTLLTGKPDINLQDKSNDTALSLAIQNGHRNTAKVLLMHSDNITIKYDGNRELILLAAEKGWDEIVELLINRRAAIAAEDQNKWTPLHYAAEHGHVNIVRMLMAHGAPIYAKTKANQTAALLAVQNGHVEVINELINYEAPDDNDKAIIDQAKLQSNKATVDFLTQYDETKSEQAQVFHVFILVIVGLLIPLVCFIGLFIHKCFRKEATDSEAHLRFAEILERCLFQQSQVMITTKLGKGVYGNVYKGYAHKILPHESETLVAVKVVQGSSEDAASVFDSKKMILSLGSELKVIMQSGGHLNVMNLLGIVSENIAKHELMVIVEYCRFGNLKDVLERHHKGLKNHSNDSNTLQMSKRMPIVSGFGQARSVTRSDMVSWSYQVAQGMQFLSSQYIVHGNLAARSILLADGNLVKISDFGLARAMHNVSVYISQKEGTPEYKWLSIESMQHRVLTSKSDVWSFGIFMWELFSLGETPFEDVEIYQLKRNISNGRTLGKPPYANDSVYEMMLTCWRLNPDSRPSFDSLENWLYQFL